MTSANGHDLTIRLDLSARDTLGALSLAELRLPPDSPEQGLSTTSGAATLLLVLAGTLALRVGARTLLLDAGAPLLLEPGARVAVWNPASCEAVVRVVRLRR